MPRIGLLSDSHGRVDVTRQAVRQLIDLDAQLLIHLGDVGRIEVLDCLATPRKASAGEGDAASTAAPSSGDDHAEADQIEAHVVFGNCDWDVAAMSRYAEDLDLIIDHPLGRLDFDHCSLAFTHGDRQTLMNQALDAGVTYLCHGHTHRPLDERSGGTRIVNPGALFRASRYTVALLDTGADEVQFVDVDDG